MTDQLVARDCRGSTIGADGWMHAPEWFAIYTRARHEKKIADQLEQRSIECFLPLYETIRKWNNGSFKVQFPLFPGYIFVRIPLAERLRVLQVPGVVRLVGFNGSPTSLPRSDIEIMRDALRQGVVATPHPYLKVGTWVRIMAGPLSGLEGILARKKGSTRVVVSLDLIMRSIAVEVDAAFLEPVSNRNARRSSGTAKLIAMG